MSRVDDYLRLRSQGLSILKIAAACGVSPQAVSDALRRHQPGYADGGNRVKCATGPAVPKVVPGVVYAGALVLERKLDTIVFACPDCGAAVEKTKVSASLTQAKGWVVRCPGCRKPRGPRRRVETDAVVADYLAGMTWDAIAAKHGVSRRLVNIRLQEAGVVGKRKAGRNWPAYRRQDYLAS